MTARAADGSVLRVIGVGSSVIPSVVSALPHPLRSRVVNPSTATNLNTGFIVRSEFPICVHSFLPHALEKQAPAPTR
jgi:hypothetical protein